MINLGTKRLPSASLKILAGALVGLATIAGLCAQTRRQLQVEVGPNQQIKIVASDVSYGEVLRALEAKLSWEIEIPTIADELNISNIRVEEKHPQDALAKLLEGSKLGYAFLGGANGSRILKVVVIPSPKGEGATQDTASSSLAYDSTKAENSSPLPMQALGPTAIEPNQAAVGATPEGPHASSRMPLSDAVKVIGAPSGVSPQDVGRRTTFSSSDAAKVIGVPPGVSPDEVGRMTTLTISEASKITGVPPGMSPSDVGKTVTLPLPTGPGKHP